MRIYIHPQGLTLSKEERSYIEDRVVSVLRRFKHHVQQVLVSVRDVNGPKGGLDKLGHATVFLNSGWSRTVRVKSSGLPELISELAKAIRAAVRSHVIRARQRPVRVRRKHRPMTRVVLQRRLGVA